MNGDFSKHLEKQLAGGGGNGGGTGSPESAGSGGHYYLSNSEEILLAPGRSLAPDRAKYVSSGGGGVSSGYSR